METTKARRIELMVTMVDHTGKPSAGESLGDDETLRSLFILIALILASSFSCGRKTLRGGRPAGNQRPPEASPPLHAPQGWQDHIANGKLVLSWTTPSGWPLRITPTSNSTAPD